MEENEGKDLAKDMKNDIKKTTKYYEKVKLELNKIKLNNVMIEEKHKKEIDKNNEIKEVVDYGIYVEFKDENIKIATINGKGEVIPNRDILKDEKYTETELNSLGNMLNILGLEKDKVDLEKLKVQLKKLEAKTKNQIEDTKKNVKDKQSNDENKKQIKNKEQIENKGETERVNTIANRLHVRQKDIFMIRATSQFFKNYPQLSETTFFFKDKDGKIKAREIIEGQIVESKFFEDSTTHLRNSYVNLKNQGDNIDRDVPWQVMKTKGLRARETQEIRIAARMEQGYLEFEEMRQGTNGEWTGYGIEKIGRDYNSKVVDNLSNTKTNEHTPSKVSNRFEAVEKTGLSDDGVQKEDLSPRVTIDRFIEEGYNRDEAISIYNYMIGEEHLSEEAAKERVNDEIAIKIEKDERELEEGEEKTPWGDALARRNRR